MLRDEEKDNVFKISVPIITNEELEKLDYTIENDLDNIVHQISKTVSRDKDIIILKKVIEKQSKEIEELKDKCKELIFEKQELTSALLDSTPDDKIKAKIEEIDIEIQCCEYADDDTEEYKQDIEKEKRRLLRDKAVLQSLLEKE